MNGVNSLTLIGRTGAAAELEYTKGGKPVCRFSMATNTRWIGQAGQAEGKKSQTDWHNIVVTGKLAEPLAAKIVKGSLVHVEGEVTHRKWQSQSGPRIEYEVLSWRAELLGERETSGNGNYERAPVPDDDELGSRGDDEAPF